MHILNLKEFRIAVPELLADESAEPEEPPDPTTRISPVCNQVSLAGRLITARSFVLKLNGTGTVKCRTVFVIHSRQE